MKIITISREFGSGGRTIAKKTAERLQIPYYDKELVKQVALQTGFDEEFVEEQGEATRADRWLRYSFAAWGGQGTPAAMSADDFLWTMQRQVILELADKGPCLILGRCADYVLRERPDCLRVFIHADLEKRAERIVRLYGEAELPPHKRLEEKDKRRRRYYKRYTEQEWGQTKNYHLTMDSGVIGLDQCVDLLVDLYQNL